MKTDMRFFPLLAALFLPLQPLLAAESVTLRWVGCGISKKAYMSALAKAYEATQFFPSSGPLEQAVETEVGAIGTPASAAPASATSGSSI